MEFSSAAFPDVARVGGGGGRDAVRRAWEVANFIVFYQIPDTFKLDLRQYPMYSGCSWPDDFVTPKSHHTSPFAA